MILPFCLGEITYWLPVFAFGFLCLFKPIWWIAWSAFWGVYVGVLPAIPIQMAIILFYKKLFDLIKRRKSNDNSK